MRVLHVINGEHYSGAERVQDLLALRLPRYGAEVGFVCVKPVRFPECRASHVPLFELPMRSKLDWSVGSHIADIVREGKYNLIHAHTPRSALVSRIAVHYAKVPMVYHIHSPARFDTANHMRNRVNAISERLVLGKAKAMIAVSGTMKEYMQREGFDEALIHVVPNGVPVGVELLPWKPPEARAWEIGMVALFRPRKGLEVLLNAMGTLKTWGIDVKLRAVGPFESEEYCAHINRLVQELGLEGAVHWVGYTQNMQQEFAQMDIFVLPSLFGEGLPMVLLEAMGAGVPVIAADVEGVAEAIRHEMDGLLTKPGDAQNLADMLQAAITGQHDVDSFRRSAYARQRKEFSDERMAESVAHIYRALLAC